MVQREGGVRIRRIYRTIAATAIALCACAGCSLAELKEFVEDPAWSELGNHAYSPYATPTPTPATGQGEIYSDEF